MFATIRKGAGAMRDHLGRLLYHTLLKAIQWINLNRHQAEHEPNPHVRAQQGQPLRLPHGPGEDHPVGKPLRELVAEGRE